MKRVFVGSYIYALVATAAANGWLAYKNLHHHGLWIINVLGIAICLMPFLGEWKRGKDFFAAIGDILSTGVEAMFDFAEVLSETSAEFFHKIWCAAIHRKSWEPAQYSEVYLHQCKRCGRMWHRCFDPREDFF